MSRNPLNLPDNIETMNSGSQGMDSTMTNRKLVVAYFALIVAIVMALGFMVMLTHAMLVESKKAVETNKLWEEHASRLSELDRLAAAVDAPGNEIFESRDVARGSANLRQALLRFAESSRALETDLSTLSQTDGVRPILDGLKDVQMSVEGIGEDAKAVLSEFAANRLKEAAIRMAKMDRQLRRSDGALTDLRVQMENIRKRVLHDQEMVADRFVRVHFLIAALLIAVAAGLTFYWLKLIQAARTSAREKEGFIRALQDEAAKQQRFAREREQALAKAKLLSGLLPICASCKKIRDDSGYWNQVEVYVRSRSEAEFTHSICPDCERRLYPDLGAHRL